MSLGQTQKKKVSWTVRYLSRFVCMPCCSIIRPNTNNHNKREHQHDVYEQALSTHGVLINENKLWNTCWDQITHVKHWGFPCFCFSVNCLTKAHQSMVSWQDYTGFQYCHIKCWTKQSKSVSTDIPTPKEWSKLNLYPENVASGYFICLNETSCADT